jgi:hypothetical protein
LGLDGDPAPSEAQTRNRGPFRTDYEDDFKKEYAVGDTIRVKYPWRPILRDGLAYNPQNIERLETTIKVDQPFGIGLRLGPSTSS